MSRKYSDAPRNLRVGVHVRYARSVIAPRSIPAGVPAREKCNEKRCYLLLLVLGFGGVVPALVPTTGLVPALVPTGFGGTTGGF